jgi:adenosylmethionine-8-amino-7-oxononanoate aminotransferase
MHTPDWVAQGQPHIWLPYAQMKTATPPLPVVRSHGSRLELADGRSLIDGVASWWTACHGYNHPHIAQAVRAQLDAMPHVMFGGLTHEPALTLARRLAGMLGPGLDRVFYTDSGSVAVEVAMKMALQFWLNQGERGRSRFLAFRGGYHGDTFGTMAVCDPDEGMHSLYRGMLAEHDIVDLPRGEAELVALEAHLESHGSRLAGILVEPLVQGAGGMLLHDPEVLRRDLHRLWPHWHHVRLRAGRHPAGHRDLVQGADRRHPAAGRHGGQQPGIRGVLVRRSFARADARPHLHGQCAGLRRSQRFAGSL